MPGGAERLSGRPNNHGTGPHATGRGAIVRGANVRGASGMGVPMIGDLNA